MSYVDIELTDRDRERLLVMYSSPKLEDSLLGGACDCPTLLQVFYYMPDFPNVLSWQTLVREDSHPGYPLLLNYLGHWIKHIEGRLHSFMFDSAGTFVPSDFGFYDVKPGYDSSQFRHILH